ncbi:MAG: YigZ family protein [Oscillospiraceae bacterium]|nr:YigZ family protein [Oscillospiraceae bacterium]
MKNRLPHNERFGSGSQNPALNPHVFLTVDAHAASSFFEKHSEFIGNIANVSTGEEAVAFINEVRTKHPKAAHNVYAYIVRNDNISRHSDDGEPSGTAGLPVLETLKKKGLQDVCLVVTRYFGGVLLGTGGLARAYSKSALLTVEAAEIVSVARCLTYKVTADYALHSRIMSVFPRHGAKVLDTQYSGNVVVKFLVLEEYSKEFTLLLTDITSGNAVIEKSEAEYVKF